MNFFDLINKRRSIRQFTQTVVPEDIIIKALDAALLAPNSSNMQTWDFYWIRSEELKKNAAYLCMNQPAAKTASDLIVVVASLNTWKRSLPKIQEFIKVQSLPKSAFRYYFYTIPKIYSFGFLGMLGYIKKLFILILWIKKPMNTRFAYKTELQEVCIKSSALAAQNFVMAITAQNYGTCMMEGFDEIRMSRLLKLDNDDRITMVIAVGEPAADGIIGPRFRIESDLVIHKL